MRTMFVFPEPCAGKKKFQKPNILRRNTKIEKPNIQVACDSTDGKTVYSAPCVQQSSIEGLELENIPKLKCKPLSKLKLDSYEENKVNNTPDNDNTDTVNNMQINKNEEILNQDSLNIDSFLNSTQTSTLLYDNETQDEQKWCFNLGNDSQGFGRVLEEYADSELDCIFSEQKSDFITTMVPLSSVSSKEDRKEEPKEVHDSLPVKFKCDVPECNKEFISEQKLKRHKNIHNKDKKPPRLTTVECPVKSRADGEEKACGKIFLMRDELLKHLGEDHTIEDAPHRCDECGRRFFFASGARAHARSHCVPPPRACLPCAWPGCGRVFRLPCRLREHARAHTGDKPYHCRHPNCGQSFRSSSKLVRHSRRHTGERRHACAACGRAFLRAEHLREHAVRYHLPARARHACQQHGCTRSFTNMSSLYLHMKKVHREPPPDVDAQNIMFTVSLMNETDTNSLSTSVTETEDIPIIETMNVKAVDLNVSDREWQSARTHCTWPLPRVRNSDPVESDPEDPVEDTDDPADLALSTVLIERSQPAYVLEEDYTVSREASEGAESSIYTVRSDLFLHGNILHNEDSEHMSSVHSGGGVELAPLDADLGLLDAHSNIDLMQEELMYPDAVDETSFQVLLLSEELS